MKVYLVLIDFNMEYDEIIDDVIDEDDQKL